MTSFNTSCSKQPTCGGISAGNVNRFLRADWRIETASGGGLEPRWRSDGKELFYYGLDYVLMAVPVKAGDVFES